MRHRPQNITNAKDSGRVALVYKNFAASKGIVHIGLGVAALNAACSLRQAGLWVDVWPCNTAADINARLVASRCKAVEWGEHPVSHIVISVPWVSASELQDLLTKYPDVEFAVISHSNLALALPQRWNLDLFGIVQQIAGKAGVGLAGRPRVKL